MASRKSRLRLWLKRLALLVLILAIIPVVQILLASRMDFGWSPMQWQRQGEGTPAKPVIWVPLGRTPTELVHVFWASEDQNFFRHRGFDLQQLQKALRTTWETGRPLRGSSTITMQCARSTFLWQGRSYLRKALEAYYTFWMESLLSKQRILELYLNHIELGPGIYGIGAAANHYFQKTPKALTRSEMVALAAILPNPLKWSPVRPSSEVQKKIRRVERLAARAPFPDNELP